MRAAASSVRALSARRGAAILPLAFAIAAASLAPGASAQKKPAGPALSGVRWARNYDAAFAEAKERNVPIVIIFIQDGEAQNEEYALEVTTDKEVLKVSRQAVFMIASQGSEENHGRKVVTDKNGQNRNVCAKYGEVSCLDHQRIERQAFLQYTTGEINTPHTYVCDTEGKVLSEEDDHIPTAVLVKMVNSAIATLGKGMSEDEWVDSQASLVVAEEKWKKVRESTQKFPLGSDLPDAIRLYSEVALPARKDALAERARKRLAEIVALGDELVKDAALKEERELWGEALAHWRVLSTQWKGTALEKTAKTKLRELQDRPEVKSALKSAEAEDAAKRLFDAADDQMRRREYEKGIRGFMKLAESHAKTQAGADAAARLETLRADPEMKVAFRRLAEEDGKRGLSLAENYAKNGNVPEAVKTFQSVIDQYPDTDAAKTAAARIAALKK